MNSLNSVRGRMGTCFTLQIRLNSLTQRGLVAQLSYSRCFAKVENSKGHFYTTALWFHCFEVRAGRWLWSGNVKLCPSQLSPTTIIISPCLGQNVSVTLTSSLIVLISRVKTFLQFCLLETVDCRHCAIKVHQRTITQPTSTSICQFDPCRNSH